MMKKSLLMFLAAAATLPAMAQLQGSGYYRVQNYGSGRYIEVVDNYGSIDYVGGTANLSAIQLQRNFDEVSYNPGSVLYISPQSDNHYAIDAQGTSVYQIINHNLTIAPASKDAQGNQLYLAYASYAGVTRYLGDSNKLDADLSGATTTGGGDLDLWYILPMQTEGVNFFGDKLEVAADGKYYSTLYTSFPYSPAQTSTKAYYIGRVDHEMAEMIPINGLVPAATPVIIEGVSPAPADNRMNIGGTASAPSGNSLKGVYFNFGQNGRKNYVTYNPETMRVLGTCKDGSLGFIKSNISVIPANSAYISVPAGSPDEFKCVSTAEFDAYTPPAPEYPEALYAVGNFNDWNFPTASGYVTLQKIGEGIYTGEISYDMQGLLEFKVFDRKTNNWDYAYGAASSESVRLTADTPYSWQMAYGNGTANFSVLNWGASKGTVTVNLVDNTLSIVTDITEHYPENLWLVGNFNNWTVTDTSFPFNNEGEGIYTAQFTLPYYNEFMQDGDPLQFKLLTDQSWTNNYGAPGNADYEFDLYNDFDFSSDVVPNGQNWSVSNWDGGELILKVDLKNLTIDIKGPQQPNAPLLGEQVYLVGDMTGWSMNSSDYVLIPEDSKTYSNTFDLNPGTYYFRFYTELGNMEENSIGSAPSDDFNEVITFNSSDLYNSPYTFGMGTWELSNWLGGNLTMTLNTDARRFIVYAQGAKINSVSSNGSFLKFDGNTVYSSEETEFNVFNISGKKVVHAKGTSVDLSGIEKGVYLIITPSESMRLVR